VIKIIVADTIILSEYFTGDAYRVITLYRKTWKIQNVWYCWIFAFSTVVIKKVLQANTKGI